MLLLNVLQKLLQKYFKKLNLMEGGGGGGEGINIIEAAVLQPESAKTG